MSRSRSQSGETSASKDSPLSDLWGQRASRLAGTRVGEALKAVAIALSESIGAARSLSRDDTQSSLPAILLAQSLSLGQISRGVQRSSVSSSRHKTPLTVCVENTKAPNLVLECILLCTGAVSLGPRWLARIKPDPLFLTVTGTPIARPVSEPRSPPALDPGPVPSTDRGSRRGKKRGGADRASGDPAKRSRRRRVRVMGLEDRPTDESGGPRARVLGVVPSVERTHVLKADPSFPQFGGPRALSEQCGALSTMAPRAVRSGSRASAAEDRGLAAPPRRRASQLAQPASAGLGWVRAECTRGRLFYLLQESLYASIPSKLHSSVGRYHSSLMLSLGLRRPSGTGDLTQRVSQVREIAGPPRARCASPSPISAGTPLWPRPRWTPGPGIPKFWSSDPPAGEPRAAAQTALEVPSRFSLLHGPPGRNTSL
ncbi:hypothetical protein Q5P01_000527 [Channa striata]|uniref:Uncharacterized protein n=1 Tax=Channa striata TaxID=64152 RepID=A0AA88IGS5_CHASR|nr:hypothetical protein Q5P01_000527 [Channa striata]